MVFVDGALARGGGRREKGSGGGGGEVVQREKGGRGGLEKPAGTQLKNEDDAQALAVVEKGG